MQLGMTRSSYAMRQRQTEVLLWRHSSFFLSLLIELGADNTFIDGQLAHDHNVPLELLPEHHAIFDLNGREIATVTQRTQPLTLIILCNHQEHISLFLIPSSAAPGVLGLPWLSLHKPQIDWWSGSIADWSVMCHSRCLGSARPQSVREAKKLRELLVHYLYLAEVFSKQRALSLPPHHPYDCAADPFPGAAMSPSRLFNLSRPEHESME